MICNKLHNLRTCRRRINPRSRPFPTLFRIRPRASHPYQCMMCSCKAASWSPLSLLSPPHPSSNGLEINKPYSGLNRGFTVSTLSSHEYPVAQWFFRATCVLTEKSSFSCIHQAQNSSSYLYQKALCSHKEAQCLLASSGRNFRRVEGIWKIELLKESTGKRNCI